MKAKDGPPTHELWSAAARGAPAVTFYSLDVCWEMNVTLWLAGKRSVRYLDFINIKSNVCIYYILSKVRFLCTSRRVEVSLKPKQLFPSTAVVQNDYIATARQHFCLVPMAIYCVGLSEIIISGLNMCALSSFSLKSTQLRNGTLKFDFRDCRLTENTDREGQVNVQ